MLITVDLLKQIAPRANMQIISDLAKYLDQNFADYEINTHLRVCHFLAQAAEESDSFRTLQEYASGREYEGRSDLGNKQPGDGPRYKGRGIFQITGRANYRVMSDALGVDLINHPELAATGEISVETAMEYWDNHNLNDYADKDDSVTITRKINGGTNGLATRQAFLAVAKRVVPQTFTLPPPTPDTPDANSAPKPAVSATTPIINIIAAKIGDNSDYVKTLQGFLIKKGETITADGAFGPLTETAVKDYQTKNNIPVTGQIDTATLALLEKP